MRSRITKAAGFPDSQYGDESGFIFVPVDQILWIEAANKYVVVHTAAGTHIARQTIQSLQDEET